MFHSVIHGVIKLYFRVVCTFGKPDSGVFEGLDRFSCLIFVDCGVVMAIRVHRCDNFDVCAERIPINPDSRERLMRDCSNIWSKRVVVECVCRQKQVQV